jgi:hypothetical protein
MMLAGPGCAGGFSVDEVVTDTAEYLHTRVESPQVGSVGGEWAIIGLARSGYEIPQSYFDTYYASVADYVEDREGVLHRRKHTEYSRIILALTAVGRDPRDVASYNLLRPLSDFEKTIQQGINGPVWALVALDSGGYDMPRDPTVPTQATRDMYVDEILSRQLANGCFALAGGGDRSQAGDPDVTAMALQALARYQDRPDVRRATEAALNCLSELQDETGGFSNWGAVNSESVAQVIVGLTELGVSVSDPQFVKSDQNPVDKLLAYYQPGEGFVHTASGAGSSQMATEQALLALVAAQRASRGETSLYDMSDVKTIAAGSEGDEPTAGLPGKHPDVQPLPITEPGRTFADIVANENRQAIDALAARGIIEGRTESSFAPEATMTRAEFATIVVRGLGLTPEIVQVFSDVPDTAWYAPYVGAAYQYGIVEGTSATTFAPGGTITRQEAATMVARAADLCGMDTDVAQAVVINTLAQFGDYTEAAS